MKSMKLKRVPAVRNAVQPVLEALERRQFLSATIGLVNPDVYPSNDRLIFNYIQHPDATVPNVVHDRQTLQITDTGDTPLIISSMAITGPWQFINAPVGGYVNITVNPGTPLNVTLQFTQRSLPAKSYNETNFTNNVNGGAEIDGSLTINSNDSATPSKVVTLAGYWQNESNSNAEPSLQTIVNLMAGFTTNINPTPIPDLSQPSGAQLYGEEVYSTAWSAADPSQPVSLQQLDAFHTEGNSAHVYWYTASNQSSHSLFTEPGNQGQSVLPTLSSGALAEASFNPNGDFGLRVDDEYSNDAINVAAGNTGGGGHHFRFFPLRDENGNYVPNTYIVAMDYGVLQAENFDFQDNAFIVTNIRPATTPASPTGLTATNGANPVLTWNPVNYSPVGYNVYRSSTLTGTYTLLTSTPISVGTTFTDTTAPGGVDYYHVTAVDSTQSPVAESVPASTYANGGPVTTAFTFNDFSGQAYAFNPLVGATDATGTINPATVQVSGTNHGGTVSVNSTNGLITYTPTNNFVGTETFTYTVSDSNSATSTASTVTFKDSAPTVVAPVANNLVATTLMGTAVQIPILDTDLPVTTFNLASVTITSQPTDGAVVVNSDGTVTYTPTGNFVGGDEFKYTVADNNGQTSNVAIVDINMGVEISSAKGASHAVLFQDQTGTSVTVTLNKGIADIFFDGTGAATTTKGRTTVTGSSMHIREAALSSTTLASVFSIVGKKNGAVTLGGITDSSPIGTISARTSNLLANGSTVPTALNTGVFDGGTFVAAPQTQIATPVVTAGTINVAGVRSLILKSAAGAIIDVGNSGVTASSVVILGGVTDTSLDSSVPLTTLKASYWTNTQNNAMVVVAPTIGNLVIAGEFDPDLTLTGGAKPTSLASARVGTAVNTGAWSITGNVTRIVVGSANAGWGGTSITGSLGALVVRTGGLSSDLSATSIGTLTVAGVLSANVTTTANINSVVASALDGVDISAGVQADTAVATATATELGDATIKNVRLTSHAASTFSNSEIMAGTINNASLGAVNTSNGGTPEGLAAVTVKSVTLKTGGTLVHLGAKQLTDNATLAAYLAGKGISFGDFLINLAPVGG